VPLAEPAENANYASVPTTTVFAGRFVPSENNIAALDSAAFHPSGGMKTTFGRRKRLAPCSASTEDTNELISAFTRSANSLELQEQKETDAKESSSLGMAPNAVAYSGEVSSSQFQLSTPFENDLESTKREGSIFAQSPFQKLPVLARQAADAPALGTKETAEQEARAICSIKRGIKVFTILGSFLLVVLVYECTKQSIFRTITDSAAAIGANTLALNIFDTQLSKDKASLSMLTEWASKDQARGRIAKAMSYYSRAIALDPKDYVLFLNRAVLNFDLRQLKEAIADDNKAIALSPNCALAYNNRGLAYRSEGNYNQALADFNKAIALSSTQPRNSFWLNRGMCFLHMRRYKEAIQDFNLATQHGNETAKNMKAIAIMQAKHIHRLEATVNSSRHHHHS
jgi:tetratricopeptide (TPR) repeat protein